MIDRVPSSGSCCRCQRSLGLASVKLDGRWYGSPSCAQDGDCPLEKRNPALYTSPRRFFRSRAPKELKRNA